MAGFFDNIKNKIQEWKHNAKGANNVPEQQPSEEDLIADAEINRRIEKQQTKEDQLNILAYMSDYVGEATSGGKKWFYICLNKDYREEEEYADLAKWICSNIGLPMKKHLSHLDGTEQFVLRMPIEEQAKHRGVLMDFLERRNIIRGFQFGSVKKHLGNGKMVDIKFPRQSYDRAVAKLKLKMDAEKTQKVKNQPDLSR
ncbi:MAG: hypothetical protein IKP05_01705 [Alphaproteobacteria bacterium]|nr:hypothetical protein [Alphaproteobacteria bacterium]